jgi:hypothetical protein
MSAVTQSGIVFSDNGTRMLITQGLTGYTLVTKKKILFRLFVDPFYFGPTRIINSVAVTLTFRIPNTNWTFKKHFLVPSSQLLIENSPPNGPSIGIILDGKVFTGSALIYSVEFDVITTPPVSQQIWSIHTDNTSIGVIRTDKTPDMRFSPSGSLRILAKSIQSITRTAPWGNKIQANIFWLVDLVESMIRLGAMLPVSDGVSFGSNPGPDVGLAYVVGEPIDAWPEICPGGAPPSVPDNEFPSFLVCPRPEMLQSAIAEAKQLRSMGIRIDITVAWRLRDLMKPPTGERASGQAPFGFNPAAANRLATVVGGLQNGFETTASAIAHEVAHNFNVVSTESPHFDGGGHSTTVNIIDPFAFDFVRLKHYYPSTNPVADVMGIAWGRGRDLVLFSAFDWEHLRKKLAALPGMAVEIVDKTETDEFQKKVVDDIQKIFAVDQQIEVENPESILASKSGFQWHWTNLGFQLLEEQEQNSKGFTLNIDMLFSTLKKLGIKEFYAPIDGKPMTVVINLDDNNYMKCEVASDSR